MRGRGVDRSEGRDRGEVGSEVGEGRSYSTYRSTVRSRVLIAAAEFEQEASDGADFYGAIQVNLPQKT